MKASVANKDRRGSSLLHRGDEAWLTFAPDAAVLLTTRAFELMARDRSIGRAEAMRHAMNALIDDPSLAYVHPSVWAPFAVVGDSGPAGL